MTSNLIKLQWICTNVEHVLLSELHYIMRTDKCSENIC